MVKALILIADGTEEMEFTIVYDTLVRAGVSCTSALVREKPSPYGSEDSSPALAECSRGIKILPDTTLRPLEAGPDKYDAIVIPGGAKGADTISKSSPVQHLIREYYEHKKLVGMICAGSLAALRSGLPSQRLTSHPSVKADLDKDFKYSEDPVVVSGNLVTSRGPGTAFPFALKLVELLCDADKRDEIRSPMMFPEGTPF